MLTSVEGLAAIMMFFVSHESDTGRFVTRVCAFVMHKLIVRIPVNHNLRHGKMMPPGQEGAMVGVAAGLGTPKLATGLTQLQA